MLVIFVPYHVPRITAYAPAGDDSDGDGCAPIVQMLNTTRAIEQRARERIVEGA